MSMARCAGPSARTTIWPACWTSKISLRSTPELFGYNAGQFTSEYSERCDAYLDFILYDEDDLTWVAPTTYRSTPKSVFEKILPDIDLEVVHYCEFEWFNMVDAPDVY